MSGRRIRYVDLYAGRHTDYSTAGPEPGALTEEGQRNAEALAGLFGQTLPPGPAAPLVLHSKALRTITLAHLVATATGGQAQQCDWAFSGPKDLEALLDACRGHRVIVVCGHEPLLNKLMQLAEGREYRANKGEFHHFRLDLRAGTIEYVRQLTAGEF